MPAKTAYSVSLWAGGEWEHVSTYGSFQEAKREWVMESDIVAEQMPCPGRGRSWIITNHDGRNKRKIYEKNIFN